MRLQLMTIIILFWCGSAFGSCAVPYKPVSPNVSSEPQTFFSVTALSSVTSVRVVIGHVNSAGLDKALLGNTPFILVGPTLCE